jgi:hypothetical protein
MKTILEAITEAKKIMKANNLPFATIWKTGKLYGFNFDKKPVGYSFTEYSVKRTVIQTINT